MRKTQILFFILLVIHGYIFADYLVFWLRALPLIQGVSNNFSFDLLILPLLFGIALFPLIFRRWRLYFCSLLILCVWLVVPVWAVMQNSPMNYWLLIIRNYLWGNGVVLLLIGAAVNAAASAKESFQTPRRFLSRNVSRT